MKPHIYRRGYWWFVRGFGRTQISLTFEGACEWARQMWLENRRAVLTPRQYQD